MPGAAGVLIAVLARTVLLEVMDKEPTVLQLWESLLWPVAGALVLGCLWRWCLVVTYCFGLVGAAAWAWTEWHHVHVGSAMKVEAGDVYGLHVHTVLVLLVTFHVAMWFASSRFRRRRMQRRGTWRVDRAWVEALRYSVFVGVLTWLMADAAVSGFSGTEDSIYRSPPFVALGLAGALAVLVWIKALHAGRASDPSGGLPVSGGREATRIDAAG